MIMTYPIWFKIIFSFFFILIFIQCSLRDRVYAYGADVVMESSELYCYCSVHYV